MKSMTDGAMRNKRPLSHDILFVLVGAAAILMVPLVAMQFSSDVNWSLPDFVIMGVLLVGMGLMYVTVSRNLTNPRYRLAVGVGLAFALLLMWAELAVGVFGSPFAGS